MRDMQYVAELAETVNNMFAAGIYDPSADEIARAHFPDRALAGEIVESVRKRLPRVRNVLEQDYEHPVCLLSPTYYTRFRKTPPINEAEARRCLPMGHGVRAAGIRLQTQGDEDLIWQAMLSQDIASGAGKVRKAGDRTLTAVEEHRLEMPRAASLLKRAQKQAAPENLALASEVMKALPAEEE
jgi:Ni,Fe-hydrogenase III large subunit